MLQRDSGHCGAWASFLAMVLAYQGISAGSPGLGRLSGFDPGPAPAPGDDVRNYAYMLVGLKLWGFSNGTAAGRYHFSDRLHVVGGKVEITGTEVTYSSTMPIAQGPVATPPMWFNDGDHAIVEVSLPGGNKWVDPSYANPQGTGYYPNVKAYEQTAIAGFAVVYEKLGTKLVPVPNSRQDVLNDCGTHVCFFQAVPL